MSWFQSSYASIPGQGVIQGDVCLLDNGQMWILLASNYDPVEGTWWSDSVHLYMVESPGAPPKRMTGDMGQLGWLDGGEGSDNFNMIWSDGLLTDTGIDTDQGYARMFSNGTSIFLLIEPQFYTNHYWLMEINPETLEFEFRMDFYYQEAAAYPYAMAFKDNWMYYPSVNDPVGAGEDGVRIRRLNTDTWSHGVDVYAQAGFNSNAWEMTINPATGLPNAFNSNYLAAQPSQMALHDGLDGHTYIYILDSSAAGQAIRRIDAQGGGWATLWYTYNTDMHLANPDPDYPYLWGDEYDEHVTDTIPDGFLKGYGATAQADRWHKTATNVPQWKGFLGNWIGFAIFGEGSYLAIPSYANTGDAPGDGWIGGGNNVCQSLCVFPLAEIVQTVINPDSPGPIRHDKANPIFEVVANDSYQVNNITNSSGTKRLSNYKEGRYPNKAWVWRDGPSRDALMWMQYSNFGVSDHPHWAGKLYVHHINWSSFLNWAFVGGNARMCNVIAQIEPENLVDFTHEIRVRFSGTALKGYAPVHGGQKSETEWSIILE